MDADVYAYIPAADDEAEIDAEARDDALRAVKRIADAHHATADDHYARMRFHPGTPSASARVRGGQFPHGCTNFRRSLATGLPVSTLFATEAYSNASARRILLHAGSPGRETLP